MVKDRIVADKGGQGSDAAKAGWFPGKTMIL